VISAPRFSLSLAAIVAVVGASVAWAHFGGAIYFDLLAASFAGCLF
jgi:hypothetical protein